MRKTSQIPTATEANRTSGPTPDRAPQARALSAAELDLVAAAGGKTGASTNPVED